MDGSCFILIYLCIHCSAWNWIESSAYARSLQVLILWISVAGSHVVQAGLELLIPMLYTWRCFSCRCVLSCLVLGLVWVLVFYNRVSLCSPGVLLLCRAGCLRTHRHSPASALSAGIKGVHGPSIPAYCFVFWICLVNYWTSFHLKGGEEINCWMFSFILRWSEHLVGYGE